MPNSDTTDTVIVRQIETAEKLARLLDEQFKLFGIKIGLDPIVGLIPGLGDIAPAVVSVYIVYVAAKAGVPKTIMARMVINILVDLGLGTTPVIGDIIDVFSRPNTKNIELLKKYAKQ